jgi:HEAT repeat protein
MLSTLGGNAHLTMRARKSIWIILIVLIVTGVTIWLLAPIEPRYQNQMVQTRFDQLQGYTGDPVIQRLRDVGPDAVAFLAYQMKHKDSVLRDRYVALWPKLPAFVKSRLKQPMSAAAIRVKAVGALRQMGPSFTGSEIGLAALTTALSHPDIELRSRAEGALGDLGPQSKSALPVLIKSVERRTRTNTGHMDINGIWALGRIGPDAKAALPLLESIMKEHAGRERVYAAEAVLRIGGDSTAAITALENALADSDPQARREAATALSHFGQPTNRRPSGLTQQSDSR